MLPSLFRSCPERPIHDWSYLDAYMNGGLIALQPHKRHVYSILHVCPPPTFSRSNFTRVILFSGLMRRGDRNCCCRVYGMAAEEERSQPCYRQSASASVTTLIFLFFLTPVVTSFESYGAKISFKFTMMTPRGPSYTELCDDQIRLLMLQSSR